MSCCRPDSRARASLVAALLAVACGRTEYDASAGASRDASADRSVKDAGAADARANADASVGPPACVAGDCPLSLRGLPCCVTPEGPCGVDHGAGCEGPSDAPPPPPPPCEGDECPKLYDLAVGCCLTPDGPCGYDYGDGCVPHDAAVDVDVPSCEKFGGVTAPSGACLYPCQPKSDNDECEKLLDPVRLLPEPCVPCSTHDCCPPEVVGWGWGDYYACDWNGYCYLNTYAFLPGCPGRCQETGWTCVEFLPIPFDRGGCWIDCSATRECPDGYRCLSSDDVTREGLIPMVYETSVHFEIESGWACFLSSDAGADAPLDAGADAPSDG